MIAKRKAKVVLLQEVQVVADLVQHLVALGVFLKIGREKMMRVNGK